jgi:hypothetical protein
VVGPQTTRNGVVTIDPYTTWSGVAWDHSLAWTSQDMSRWRHVFGSRRNIVRPRQPIYVVADDDCATSGNASRQHTPDYRD